MKSAKRAFALFITTFALTALTACGGKDEKAIPAPAAQKVIDSENNGSVQNVANSDEELKAVQKEEQQGASEKKSSDNNTLETKTEYVPAFGFWQGDSFFDMDGYLKANCNDVRIGKLDRSTYSFVESDEKHDYYIVHFDSRKSNYVSLSIYGTSVHDMRIMHGDSGYHYTFWPMQIYDNLEDKVVINQTGYEVIRPVIDSIDYAIQLYKANPEAEDPFTGYEDGRFGQNWIDKEPCYIVGER